MQYLYLKLLIPCTECAQDLLVHPLGSFKFKVLEQWNEHNYCSGGTSILFSVVVYNENSKHTQCQLISTILDHVPLLW